MTNVYLAYKAYDIHELLCHAIADAGGLYAKARLSVKLIDSTFTPDEALPEATFHAACGAALASFLSGQPRKVVFVACDRPMFWLYGRPGIDSVQDLSQARVATFADNTPPGRFFKRYLQQAGVAPGLLPARDDTSRLGLLASCSVDGALLSSHYLPYEVEARGAKQIAFLGDELRLPSSGLAVSGELQMENPKLVASMVAIYQEAMKLVFADDQTLLRRALQEYFGKAGEGLDEAVAIIRHCYNPFGFSYDSVLQPGVDLMASSMHLSSRPSGELYEFKFIKSHH